MYIAYTAPHWPLHAKKEDIEKYQNIYDNGWDKLRQERYKKLKDLNNQKILEHKRKRDRC